MTSLPRDAADRPGGDGSHRAIEFLTDLFTGSMDENPIYLSSLPNERGNGPGERHALILDLAETAGFVDRMDRPGLGTYFCVNPLKPSAARRCKENIAELIGLHGDIDLKSCTSTREKIEQKLRQLRCLPSKIVWSGHGFHVYWLFREALPATSENIAYVEAMLRRLAELLAGDPAVCHVAALMRVAGSHNSKNGEWIEVNVIEDRPTARYEPEDLDEWLETASPLLQRKPAVREAAANGNGAGTNPFLSFAEATGKQKIDVEARLAAMTFHGAGDTAIHITQVQCSASLLSCGVPVDDVVERLLEATRRAAGVHGAGWNWSREKADLRDMCVSWVKKHPSPDEDAAKDQRDAEQPDPLAGFYFDGNAQIEPPAMLVDALLCRNGIAVIGGQSNAGKTFLATLLMVCLASGRQFFGKEIREKVGSLYVAAEGQQMIAARIAAAKDAIGLDIHDELLPIAWLTAPPLLATPKQINAFVGKLRALDAKFRQDHGMRLGVVALDTAVATFAMKDENDNSEVAGVCARIRQVATGFGGVVIPIHHYGKAVEAGLRGASAWHAAADIVLSVLADIDPLSGAVERRELAITKSRDGVTGPVAPFTLEFTALGMTAHGQEYGSCHVVPDLQGTSQFGKAKKRKAPRSEIALRNAVIEALDRLGTDRTLRSDGPSVRAVALDHVRAEFDRRYVVDEEDRTKAARAKRVAFNRALSRLPTEFGMGEFDRTQWIWRA